MDRNCMENTKCYLLIYFLTVLAIYHHACSQCNKLKYVVHKSAFVQLKQEEFRLQDT